MIILWINIFGIEIPGFRLHVYEFTEINYLLCLFRSLVNHQCCLTHCDDYKKTVTRIKKKKNRMVHGTILYVARLYEAAYVSDESSIQIHR